MKSWVLAAGLLAAAVSSGAQAADLDDGPPLDRYGSAYEDPRYADIYRYPSRPQYSEPVPYARPPVPPAPIYRDDDDDDRYDYRGPRRYSYNYNGPRQPYASHCLPREEIRHRLMQDGWRDFRDAQPWGDRATVQARRPSGRLFELTVDRCSGAVVSARPLEAPPYGPYAYGPRRWDRAY
ncbi:MAG: hypothetical protein F9K29_11855 [Hyphomicrobiaceae bacterium]|nr:MAG: hypothetical protein F9K29_11855 [Hyphomicrobiaceae bacterium]